MITVQNTRKPHFKNVGGALKHRNFWYHIFIFLYEFILSCTFRFLKEITG